MPPKLKKRDKQEKTTPISFRVDDITRHRLKLLAAYYRKGLTSIVEDLIDQEVERLEKKDPDELKKAEKFVE
jgi:predicted transcriptional regulator